MKNFFFTRFLVILLLVTMKVSASPGFSVSSNHADCDGERLTLSGDVAIDHTLGRATCDKAFLIDKKGGEDTLGKGHRVIQLEGNVIIAIAKGGELACSSATFDEASALATFYRDGDATFVEYKGLSGSEVVYADKITVDTTKQEAFFVKPHGSLRLDERDKDPVQFSADTMLLEIEQNRVTLAGDVDIFHEDVVRLRTLGEVVVTQEEDGHRKRVRYVHVVGNMNLERFEKDKTVSYTLSNDGNAIIDNKTKSVFLEKNPLHGEASQVHFQDPLGEAFANKLIVYYDQNERTFDPTRILLEGNVKLKNSVGPALLQYMIADRIEYLPSKRKLNMAALDKGRVLYYDKVNNVQISAPGLTVSRDKQTKKDQIQGVGDVRFRFLEQEIEQLKKRFLQQGEEGIRG